MQPYLLETRCDKSCVYTVELVLFDGGGRGRFHCSCTLRRSSYICLGRIQQGYECAMLISEDRMCRNKRPHAHLAVVLDDDRDRDFGMLRQPGHRFFFSVEEVEPLSQVIREEKE